MNEKLNFISNEIKYIKDTINDDLKYSSEKLNNHINFIENVYENVKNPLGYLCKAITFNTSEDDHKYLDYDSDNENDSDESENESDDDL